MTHYIRAIALGVTAAAMAFVTALPTRAQIGELSKPGFGKPVNERS